jgi:Asp-tRNA(Asn)/Glu-tRNA(Gln) amidotransferase A subunit family amidase
VKRPSRTLRDHATALRTGALLPTTLLSQHLERIQQWNTQLKGLRYVNSDRALAAAREIEKIPRPWPSPGRLLGTFFSAKDHIPVAGLPRSDGMVKGAEQAAPQSAPLINTLESEGAICLGKGNMAEKGKSYFTESSIGGRSCNPFDLMRTPGGSSGGDAVAVASQFVDFAVVGDAGGSVRVPANFCGIFGLFPTKGLLPETDIGTTWHPISNLFRNIGFLSRSTEDLELLLSITSKFDPRDPFSTEAPRNAPDKKGKFAYFSSLNGVRVDPQIKDSLSRSVQQFEKLGFRGVEFVPPGFERSFGTFIILAGQAALAIEDLYERSLGNPTPGSDDGPTIRRLRERILTELPPLTADTVLQMLSVVNQSRHEIARFFQEYDFIISPVSATVPPPHDTALFSIDGQELFSQHVFQFASAINLLGIPAVAFPTELSSEGLPLGLQISGPRWSESTLLQLLTDAGFGHSLPSPMLNSVSRESTSL